MKFHVSIGGWSYRYQIFFSDIVLYHVDLLISDAIPSENECWHMHVL
jgi:hypothetical protein